MLKDGETRCRLDSTARGFGLIPPESWAAGLAAWRLPSGGVGRNEGAAGLHAAHQM